MALTILTIVSFSHLDDNRVCFSDDLRRWKAKLPPGLEMSSLHFTSQTARSWGYTPTFILVKLIYQFEGITEMFLFIYLFFTSKNGFHECSFSSVNPWIHRFAAKGNSKMRKKQWEKKNWKKKNKQKKTFDCPIGSLAAAVVSNHRELLFSDHITFIWETVVCSLQPKAGCIWFCWLCQSNSHIFFVFTF